MLEVGRFKSVHPGAARVYWLGHIASNRRRARDATEVAGAGEERLTDDGFRQVLIEIAGSDNAKGIEVMLDQHIHVVGILGLEVWVANTYGDRVDTGSSLYGLRDVLWIRTRQSAAVNETQIRVVR